MAFGLFIVGSASRLDKARRIARVEVDHVVGVFGDPDLGFPGDLRDEGLHGAAGLEGGDEDEASYGSTKMSWSNLRRLRSTAPALVTTSMSTSQLLPRW